MQPTAPAPVMPVRAELWQLPTRGVEESALDLADLNEGERERLGRFDHAPDRVSYGAAHIALRRLLGRRLNSPPAGLEFFRERCPCCEEPHGRPAVTEPMVPTHFSLSYNRNLVLIAIAAEPVGVDVETLPEAATVRNLAPELHPAEEDEIVSGNYRPETFARIWTRKEAYLKGIGAGLGRELNADYLGTRRIRPTPEGWTVINFSTDAVHAAAVAVKAPAADFGLSLLAPRFVSTD
ncbi:4'-phosphopantetheinyl transferase family protein [Streptomyces sp. NPDC017993]|uniref:4'-phosphopantetheinyl transferase family protein n=1 Tax=Streptomyces sp. NPDC017993 TaxID=3365027 RepID=UPI00378DDBE1